ncbi:NADP-dependent oxidoreductase domain containing protein [Naviculisporaceae sp. PSN 640]
MPMMIYGTAWKGDRTAELVYEAIKAGFRGIDAGVGQHYNELGVGEGLLRVYRHTTLIRASLWIQTKVRLNDERFPPSRYPTVESRVLASIKQSLCRLPSNGNQESYIDCVVIHDVSLLKPGDMLKIAAALKHLMPRRVRTLGVSNIDLERLIDLEAEGFVPAVVQNPFSSDTNFDVLVRSWCLKKNQSNMERKQFTGMNGMDWQKGYRIAYQGYQVATANEDIWENAPFVKKLAQEHIKVQNLSVWYSLCISAYVVVLNGTQDPDHMETDVTDQRKIKGWIGPKDGSDRPIWDNCQEAFRDTINGDVTC